MEDEASSTASSLPPAELLAICGGFPCLPLPTQGMTSQCPLSARVSSSWLDENGRGAEHRKALVQCALFCAAKLKSTPQKHDDEMQKYLEHMKDRSAFISIAGSQRRMSCSALGYPATLWLPPRSSLRQLSALSRSPGAGGQIASCCPSARHVSHRSSSCRCRLRFLPARLCTD